MRSFAAARDRVGNVALKGRTLLVPSMHPAGAEFLAAGFRAIGVPALVMETGTGLALGREQTSGKECFPCQVTLGDVLRHLQAERGRLGPAFDARNYAYFLPEATGPCRFGMYNKFQRLVLDRFEEFREMPIASITTADSYSAEGLVPAADATRFRLMIFMTMLVADALDRILWRARPYESRAGAVETLHAAAVAEMVRVIEKGGLRTDFRDFHGVVADTARAARGLVDPARPRRPRIGIVGEIYLRSHPFSNQDLILELERHGAEVVNATLAEWVSFISWARIREHRRGAGRHLRAGEFAEARRAARAALGHAIEYRYLNGKRRGVYAQALRHLDIAADHAVHSVVRRLDGERHFSVNVGTEAMLSIGGALEYAAHGCDGIVNVYPFTCMPGTMATAVLGPLLARMRVPYLEVPCDGTRRASRETQIRTFVWQAAQRQGGENPMKRPWSDKYDHPVPEPFSFPETTLDRIFKGTVARHPGWVALSYNDEDTTYRQLNDRINRFAHGLRSLGVEKGDRVALMLPTSPVYPLAAVAAHKIGAVIVNIGVMTKGPECAGILQATGARVLVTLDVFLPNVHASLAAAGVEHLILHSVSGIEQKLPPLAVAPLFLEKLLRSQPACEPRAAAEPGDLAVLQMTSGTSGRPKAVMLTHRNIVANLHQIESFRPPTAPANAAVICLLPFFHAFGFTICFQLSVLRGYRMVLVPRFDPLAVVPLIGLLEKYRPVLSLPAVPGLWIALTRHLEAVSPGTRALLAEIEMPSCGGAPLPPAVKERYHRLTGRRLHEAYGLSEAASTTHMTPLTKPCPPGSIGIPLPGTDARIVDLEDPDRSLDPGEVGELAVRGPQVMGGYWQTPEATESTARLKDGWLFTGDLARMDADGYFFIVDRRDDMIITSGYNVYPSEVEAVLKAHPGVADAVVVGLPDPSRGCSIVARVVPRDGHPFTDAQVLEHLRARLPDYKVPRRVLIVAEIPRSPVGKPLRRELRTTAV